MFLGFTKTIKKIKRLNQIIPVLLKYGFGGILRELKLDYYIYLSKNLFKLKSAKQFEALSHEKRFCLALQELGPTFIKLGQILSTREDVLPENWIKELEKLQDKAEPVPFKEIKEIIKNKKLNIEPTPIAAASIAQVHKATLKTGETVVVKIKRPNIDDIVRTDIMLLLQIATLLETYIPELKIFRPVRLVEEFADTILKELDFYREIQNMKNFKKIYENDDFIYIPKVFEDISSENYIVMEYVEGIKINNYDLLKAKGYDLKKISLNWSQKVIEQILIYGFFHADPHPGNILIMDNGKLAYLDFGMMGRLTEEMKILVAKLIIAITSKDVDSIVKLLKKMSTDFYVENLIGFKKDLLDFIDCYYNVPLKNFNLGKILKELFKILKKYNIQIIVDYVLLDKTILTLESIGKNLDPDFNLFENTANIVKNILKENQTITSLKKTYIKKLGDLIEIADTLPQDISEVIRQLANKNLEIKFYHKGLDQFTREMDKSTNRLTFGLVISATIVASAIILKTNLGPTWNGLSLFGLAGFLFAFICGLWLIYGILKSGRL